MTLKEELEKIYGNRTGFNKFFDEFKRLCKNLEICHNNSRNVLFQFYVENFLPSGKIDFKKMKINMEQTIYEIIGRMRDLCLSNDSNDRQSVLSFADLILYNKPISSYHLYCEYDLEAQEISGEIRDLISIQPNSQELYTKLFSKYKQFRLSSEAVRFDDCCKFIEENKYKVIDKEAFHGVLKLYDDEFDLLMEDTVFKIPAQNLPSFRQYADNIRSNGRDSTEKKVLFDFEKERGGCIEYLRGDRKSPSITKKWLEDLLEKTFKNYVGMDEVKEKLRQIVAKHKKGLIPDAPIVIMLTGSPGTGKTSASELMTKVLYECGILQQNKMTKIVASNLQGEYVGQTNPKVQRVFREARTGGLLLDEIYSLASSRTFTEEAIAELLTQLESKENAHTLVVVAGYSEYINSFIEKNPGLKDRFFSRINLGNFTHEDLLAIANKTLAKKGFRFDKQAIEEYDIILQKAEKIKNFGNARYVVNSIEEILEIQNERTFDDPSNRIVNLCDVEVFRKNQEKNKANERFSTIGFGV